MLGCLPLVEKGQGTIAVPVAPAGSIHGPDNNAVIPSLCFTGQAFAHIDAHVEDLAPIVAENQVPRG